MLFYDQILHPEISDDHGHLVSRFNESPGVSEEDEINTVFLGLAVPHGLPQRAHLGPARHAKGLTALLVDEIGLVFTFHQGKGLVGIDDPVAEIKEVAGS